MAKIQRFEDLNCWQESRILVKKIFEVSDTGRLAKDFDMKSQFRRASLSTMNNIAEGFARFNDKEFIRFLNFTQSSSAEVKSMLYVLEDFDYLNKKELEELHTQVDKVKSLTLALIKYLTKKVTLTP